MPAEWAADIDLSDQAKPAARAVERAGTAPEEALARLPSAT